jgi:hypothetical protein
MKKTLLILLTACTLMAQASAQYIDLGTLGTSNFTIDGGSIGTYTQTSTALNFTAAGLGDQIFGNYTPSNWSAYSDFGIRMTITGTNPDLPFTVSFFDDAAGSSAYQGTTFGLLDGVSGVAALTLTTPGANLGNIIGFQIGWDGAASPINVSMTDVAAVPEPSTYALLALAGAAVLGVRRFRRRRA